MKIVAIIAGLILLLPGACSLVFILAFSTDPGPTNFAREPDLLLLWAGCFLVSAFGVWLIARTLRRR